MGKRGSRSQSQLLGSLTKKQKKHLRDFGEEHPFYDRCGGAWRDARCQPPLPEGPRVSRRWARARPGAVTGRPRRQGWASCRRPARDAVFSRLPAFRWAGRFLPDPTHLKWGGCRGWFLYGQRFFWDRFVFYVYKDLLAATLVAQTVKNPPAMRETRVPSLGREDSLE